jgi:hypothetical protein
VVVEVVVVDVVVSSGQHCHFGHLAFLSDKRIASGCVSGHLSPGC